MNIEKSVVQIFSDKTIIDYVHPWSFSRKERSTGSGFAIELKGFKKETKYILTNAHCVNDSSFTTVRKQGISKTFKAKIEAIGYEVDLALLSIADKSFWKNTPPLPLGGMPTKLQKVQAYGFPLGGFNISITQGVVNRIRIIPYFHVTRGITIQIDAPINFGNSGGPVLDRNGEVIGVAFAGEDDMRTQNMGYIIPTIIIRFFLDMITRYKAFNGICALGIAVQELSNAALRDYSKLEPHQTGVLVSYIEELSSLSGKLQEGDVIMKIDNVNIDSDGTVAVKDVLISTENARNPAPKTEAPGDDQDVELALASDERVPYQNMISLRLPGEKMQLTVLRKGKTKVIPFSTKLREFLVPILPYQIPPSYYIVGGLVFVPLTLMMIERLLDAEEPVTSLLDIADAEIEFPGQQKLVLVENLLTEITDGYDNYYQILHSVNDIRIKNLEHMHKIVNEQMKKSKFLKLDYEDSSDIMVLSSSDVKKYSRSIAMDQLGVNDTYFNIPDWGATKRVADVVSQTLVTSVKK